MGKLTVWQSKQKRKNDMRENPKGRGVQQFTPPDRKANENVSSL